MTILTPLPFRAVDSSGEILPGARMQFYQAGTTTPVTVYADAGLGVPLTNPVIADAGGLFPPIYLNGGNYRVELMTALGSAVQVVDPVAIAPDPAAANAVLETIEAFTPIAQSYVQLSTLPVSYTHLTLPTTPYV